MKYQPCDKHILNMLNYIANKYSGISKRSDGIFEIDNYIVYSLGIKDTDLCRDFSSLTIDFNKKTMSLYSYDESGHNGDHFNCKHSNIDWGNLLLSFDSLLNFSRSIATDEVTNKLKYDLATTRLDEILKGNV